MYFVLGRDVWNTADSQHYSLSPSLSTYVTPCPHRIVLCLLWNFGHHDLGACCKSRTSGSTLDQLTQNLHFKKILRTTGTVKPEKHFFRKTADACHRINLYKKSHFFYSGETSSFKSKCSLLKISVYKKQQLQFCLFLCIATSRCIRFAGGGRPL